MLAGERSLVGISSTSSDRQFKRWKQNRAHTERELTYAGLRTATEVSLDRTDRVLHLNYPTEIERVMGMDRNLNTMYVMRCVIIKVK